MDNNRLLSAGHRPCHPHRGERLELPGRRSGCARRLPGPLAQFPCIERGSHTASDMRINCVRWINDSSAAESYSGIVIVGVSGSRCMAWSRTFWCRYRASIRTNVHDIRWRNLCKTHLHRIEHSSIPCKFLYQKLSNTATSSITSSQPLILLLAAAVYDLPTWTVLLCLAVDSALTAVGRLTMPARQSGTRCLTSLEILTVLIVLDGSWKQFSLAATSVPAH